MYQALLHREPEFEGVFFVGVKTTGIFCLPTCPARKPRPENVDYFDSAKSALDAGYRPCKRCKPMHMPGDSPDWVSEILQQVERDPGKHWRDQDLQRLEISPNRLRRWFKKNHGMTFQAYLRARRLGAALGRIRHGDDLTQTAFASGYESLSGFREAVRKLTGMAPIRAMDAPIMVLNRVQTPLGPMLAGATDGALCLLEFIDRRMLETQLKTVQRQFNCRFVSGSNSIIDQLAHQLKAYFKGQLKSFSVPLDFPGTEFQQRVWHELMDIPCGETRCYEQLAHCIGKPRAARAVAKANGDNRIALLIPCHRVIAKNGELSGYGGGVWRKRYLLDLEKS